MASRTWPRPSGVKNVPHHLWNQVDSPPHSWQCPNASRKVPQKFWNQVTPSLPEKYPNLSRQVPQKVWNLATTPFSSSKMSKHKQNLTNLDSDITPPPPPTLLKKPKHKHIFFWDGFPQKTLETEYMACTLDYLSSIKSQLKNNNVSSKRQSVLTSSEILNMAFLRIFFHQT